MDWGGGTGFAIIGVAPEGLRLGAGTRVRKGTPVLDRRNAAGSRSIGAGARGDPRDRVPLATPAPAVRPLTRPF